MHTGGTSQALLQLVGIPFVLGLAWIFLGQKPSITATMASLAIVGGTALSAVPHSENDTDSLWSVLYLTSCMPLVVLLRIWKACSAYCPLNKKARCPYSLRDCPRAGIRIYCSSPRRSFSVARRFMKKQHLVFTM